MNFINTFFHLYFIFTMALVGCDQQQLQTTDQQSKSSRGLASPDQLEDETATPTPKAKKSTSSSTESSESESSDTEEVTTSSTTTASGTTTTTTTTSSGTTTASTTATPTPTATPAVPGITVTSSGTTTTEAGGTATFTVKLTTAPTANVTIALSSSDTTEGTVSPASLTFTSSNYATAQTVTVTGVDDATTDGNISYTIVIAAAVSTDTNYSGLNPNDLTFTTTDDDVPGFTVSAVSGNTAETGSTATFTVKLNAQPSANVVIGLSSSDTTEGTVSPASLTFTSSNWSTNQTVTITGVDDDLDDADVSYSIVTAAATSSDSNYNGLNPADVTLLNTDNDTAGFTIGSISGNTTEAGGTATFTFKLSSQPSASVTIGLTSSNTAEGTVSPSSLTFTTSNWNTNQTVTVTGVDDSVDDGNQTYTIVTATATSTDSQYTLNPADVSVTNTDDDTAGFTISAISGATTEAGGTATFTVKLASQPTASVSIGLSSSDTTEGTVSPSSLTFTTSNWNTNQTVTVTGVDDSDLDGSISYSIVTAAASSSDSNYNSLNPSDVSVSNSDNEVATKYAIKLDGSDDYLHIPSSSTYKPTSAVTVAAWFKLNSLQSCGKIVDLPYYPAENSGWSYPYVSYSLTQGCSANGAIMGDLTVNGSMSTLSTGANVIKTGTWYHLVMTYDGSTQKLYLNGTSSWSTSVSGTIDYGSSTGIVIGRDSIGFDYEDTNGYVDDVRVYNRALTSGEITALYNNGEGSDTNLDSSGNTITGLKLWLPFDEGTGTTAVDASGNGNNATLYNGPAWTQDAMPGKHSLYFDGSDDYATLGSNVIISDSGFSTSFWVKLSSVPGGNGYATYARFAGSSSEFILNHGQNGNGGLAGYAIYLGFRGTTAMVPQSNSNYVMENFVGKWTHFVVTYNGSGKNSSANYVLYINGTAVPLTEFNTPGGSTNSNEIGRDGGGGAYLPGRMDDLRVYTKALNSTEVTSLYNSGSGLATNSISNLSGWWKFDGSGGVSSPDASSNGNTATFVNGATLTADNLFGTADGSASSNSLLMHFSGANASTNFTDSSANALTASSSGSPQVSTTQSKFGTSGYFNGSSNVSYSSSTLFNFASGDFTVEAWIYPTSVSSTAAVITTADASDYQGIFLGIDSGSLLWLIGNGSWAFQRSAGSISTNSWYHIALTRSGNVYRVFLNGSQVDTVTNSSTLTFSNNAIRIGGRSVSSQYFSGYIDEARITKGVARYTTSFDPAAFSAFADN